MAEGFINLLEFGRRFSQDNMAYHSIDLLQQHTPLLQDLPINRSSENNADTVSIKTGLPSVIRRRINQGVTTSYGERALARFELARFASAFEFDSALEDTGGSNNTVFAQSYMDTMQAMSISISHDMLYGNSARHAAAFTGLLEIYNTLNSNDPIARNVIDASKNINGVAVPSVDDDDNRTSIFMGCFGMDKIYQTIPRNAVNAGHRITIERGRINDNWNGNNEKLPTEKAFVEQTIGLSVSDWRYGVRIANINQTLVQTDIGPGGRRLGTNNTDVVGIYMPDLLYRAFSLIPTFSPMMSNVVIYANLDMIMRINQQIAHATHQSTLSLENVGGIRDGYTKGVFQNIPLRQLDQFMPNEAKVV